MTDALGEYNQRRNFKLTSEPAGDSKNHRNKKSAHALKFVIQKHDARRLHYDFRLEMDGTLKSWAIPKGPSLDPKDKRLAVHVEDHPIGYASFEGSIPPGQYGGGDVIVWDQGVWQPIDDPHKGYEAGKLKFTLIGEKLTGDWTLVKTNLRGSSSKEQWLLIKESDDSARSVHEYDVVVAQPHSVLSGALIADKGKKAKPKKSGAPKSSSKASLREAIPPVKRNHTQKTEYKISGDGISSRESNQKEVIDHNTTKQKISKHETNKTETGKKRSAKISKPAAKKLASKDSDSNIVITHPDRVVDPDSTYTKKDLVLFYHEISDWMLPQLEQRPVSIVRLPDGIGGEQFFQKHVQHLAIPHITQLDTALDPGHAALMQIDNREALLGAAQMSAIEFHTWGATSDAIETPDCMILDLDPDPALPWRSVIEATRLTLAVLDELKLDAYLKTTGGKGIHIIIPLKPHAEWDYIKEFSKNIAQFMARQIPERFVAKMGPKNRIGKIFIDYLRNQRGSSTVCAYSVRARAGLPVSVPITRDELLKLKSSSPWNIGNLSERLEKLKADPWQGYKNRQTITRTMWKKLAP